MPREMFGVIPFTVEQCFTLNFIVFEPVFLIITYSCFRLRQEKQNFKKIHRSSKHKHSTAEVCYRRIIKVCIVE